MKFPNLFRVAMYLNSSMGFFNSELEVIRPTPEYSIMEYIAEMLHSRYELIIVNRTESLTGVLVRGEADIALNLFIIEEALDKEVDFSVPYFIREIKFIIEEVGQQPKFEAFTYPFSANVWISCLLITIGATLFSKWITSSKTSSANIFVEIIGSILRQPMSVEISSPKKVIWWTTWLIWATIISTSYSALFLSFLLAPPKQPTIKTFPELSAAVHNKRYHCNVERFYKNFMSKSNEDYLRKLSEECRVVDNSKVSYGGKYVDKITAFIVNDIYIRMMQLEPPSRVVVVSEDTLVTNHHGIALRKDFCCLESINLALLSALSAGLVQKWYRVTLSWYAWRNELRRWEYHEDETRTLGMADLQYLFLVFLIGIALSVVVFLCEILIPKRIVNKFVLCPVKNIFKF